MSTDEKEQQLARIIGYRADMQAECALARSWMADAPGSRARLVLRYFTRLDEDLAMLADDPFYERTT